jgi:hypothetical protein
MHNIKNIERFNLNELKNGIKGQASWHSDVEIDLFSMIVPIYSSVVLTIK